MMKSHIKIIFCLFLFLLLSWNVKAEEFLFRQLSISEGFPPHLFNIFMLKIMDMYGLSVNKG